MPDLLTHALVGFALGRLIAVRYDLGSAGVTAAVAGAFIPDLVKARLLVTGPQVEAVLGLPFSWLALRTGGAAVVCVLVGVVLVAPEYRRRVGALLAVGAGSHLFLDALLLTPTGRSYDVFWPLTRYFPPTPGLYLSTQPEPTVVAAVLAGGVWLATRRATGDRDRQVDGAD